MARRRVERVEDPTGDVIAWYEQKLAEPAPPAARWPWPPATLGPTWQVDRDGRWILPERSIGWQVLGWCGRWLQHREGRPWRFTLEQARFLLWWYAVDDDGVFLFRDGVLQRLKGWGKDPVGACLCATEALGPARFAGWDDDGQPLATDVPDAWVQTAAVSLEQTKNTMRLFPGLFTAEAKARYGIQVGKELVHALGDTRLIQAVTSSPTTLEGARATFVLRNETHHWLANNDGHEMDAVIDRNATKSEGGSARALSITNAYEPSEDSVAQRAREAWEAGQAGTSLVTGILYDSLEAPADAPLTAEAAPAVVESIRGDSSWLKTDRIVQAILDPRNPPSRSRRFWFNQVTATEDAWLSPQDFDACAAPDTVIDPDDELVLFFDGSKSDDATGLVGCRVDDGHLVTLAMWQRPPGERGKGWTVPRAEVDARVSAVMEAHQVVAFYADPSHTRDDESQERYWDGLLDEWHRRWKDQLRIWATPGAGGHAIAWDMTSPARSQAFTAAAERFVADVEDRSLTHDGDGRLRLHVRNARRFPNRWGVSLWKGHRESPRKVDLAVCAVGARMVRRDLLNAAKTGKRQRTGVVW